MANKILLSAEEMSRALARIAHEIVEKNKGTEGIILVGMHTRGVPLAKRLALMVKGFENVSVTVGTLDIGLYRDDISSGELKLAIRETKIPIDITGKKIILVDDVLYTGRSIRAAMDALVDLGRPEFIQLAVLVDRGHRELPIRADYVGKNIPTSRTEDIKVDIVEIDGKDEVSIIKSGKAR